MINWTLKPMRDLYKELARLYDTKDSAERVVALAGIDKSFVSWQNRPVDNWYNILETAGKREQLLPLIELVIEEFPENNTLITALNTLIGDNDKKLKSQTSGNNGDSEIGKKNMVSGSTITAEGNVHIGDIHYHGATTNPTSITPPPQYSNIKLELQALIKQEKIGNALDRFLEVAEQWNLNVHNELLLLYARYNRISKTDRQNLVSSAEANVERNRINAALTDLIDELKI